MMMKTMPILFHNYIIARNVIATNLFDQNIVMTVVAVFLNSIIIGKANLYLTYLILQFSNMIFVSFWIGGCVGELNHRKFWAFLFFQTIVEYLTYRIVNLILFIQSSQQNCVCFQCFNGLDRYLTLNPNGSESYEISYGIFALLSFILFIFLLFTVTINLVQLFFTLTLCSMLN